MLYSKKPLFSGVTDFTMSQMLNKVTCLRCHVTVVTCKLSSTVIIHVYNLKQATLHVTVRCCVSRVTVVLNSCCLVKISEAVSRTRSPGAQPRQFCTTNVQTILSDYAVLLCAFYYFLTVWHTAPRTTRDARATLHWTYKQQACCNLWWNTEATSVGCQDSHLTVKRLVNFIKVPARIFSIPFL